MYQKGDRVRIVFSLPNAVWSHTGHCGTVVECDIPNVKQEGFDFLLRMTCDCTGEEIFLAKESSVELVIGNADEILGAVSKWRTFFGL